jgi:DNA-binding FadR family transcriptional regulator
MLSAGQAQYSEEQLSSQWNMGRKRIRNLLATLTDMGLIYTCRSRVASVMTFPCLLQWKTAEYDSISNPFIHEQREE